MDGRKSHKEIEKTVPETITTFQVSGFALSPTLGLGVINQPLKFVVRKPFYLVANLPYSIKRGEVVAIQVTVFNFLGNNLDTEVTLFSKNEEIEFINPSINDPKKQTKTVFTATDCGKSVSFMVKAKKLGDIAIKFEARNMVDADSIEHILRVTPESHLIEKNDARFIDLHNFQTKNYNITLDIPRKIDEGSAEILFSLNTDILGKAIENLDKLIRLPTGCGCQNMINFVPNIVVLDYLSEIDTVSEDVKTKAYDYLRKGYQNELQFKRPDGAFNVFVNDIKPSTFLTAFVAKSFKIAAKYIDVDENVVNKAFEWLNSTQNSDGRFQEVGSIWYADVQGGSNSYALTSYVLIAFGENEKVAKMYESTVNKTAQYLVNNFHNMNDVYDLSLATYGISLIKHQSRDVFLDKLIGKSIFNTSTIERYWTRANVDVQVAGYALLSYISNDRYVAATPILHWLNKQRYSRGGYAGTQDTFVGLKALSKFAAKIPRRKEDSYRVKIYTASDGDEKNIRTFDINLSGLTTQNVNIPSDSRKVRVEVNGIGFGFFQIAYQYYLNALEGKPSFNLNVTVLNTTTYNVQHLDICVNFRRKEAYKRSNMAYVEIFLPSGLIVEADAVKDKTGGIKKIERQLSDTSVIVYYDSLGETNECFQVTAYRRFNVALHLPSYVIVYDYYSRDRFAIKQYEGKVLQLCNICEDKDCLNLSC